VTIAQRIASDRGARESLDSYGSQHPSRKLFYAALRKRAGTQSFDFFGPLDRAKCASEQPCSVRNLVMTSAPMY
jgi:hypothetical protein